jgi:putative tryptophan/tyrosine transport system substrate-binding protein
LKVTTWRSTHELSDVGDEGVAVVQLHAPGRRFGLQLAFGLVSKAHTRLRLQQGFLSREYGFSGKWLELLREIAPRMTQAAVLRDPSVGSGTGQYAIIQAVASSFGVELHPIDMRDPGEIERAVAAFARVPNGGLIIAGAPLLSANRQLIIALAGRHQLPAVYPFPYLAHSGGLIAYGPNIVDSYRRAAGYVDRILKGEKPCRPAGAGP